MKLRLIHFVLFCALFYENIFAMENDSSDQESRSSILKEELDTPSQNPEKVFKLTLKNYYKTLPPQNSWGNFLRNRIASLYYATSVTGYGSTTKEKYNFFSHYFSQKTRWKKFNFSIPIDPNNFASLHKLKNNLLKCVNLEKELYAYARNSKNLDCKKLEISWLEQEKKINEMILRLSQQDSLEHSACLKKRDQLNEKILNETKTLKEMEIKYSLLPNQLHFHMNFNYLFKEREDFINIMVLPYSLYSNMVDNIPLSRDVFSLEDDNANITVELIKNFFDKFPSRKLILYTFLHQCEHATYLKLELNLENKEMFVNVYDPSVWKNDPRYWINAAYLKQTAQDSYNYFFRIAKGLAFKLTHEYHFVGNQVLNMHDCGRFSTVYLLYDLELNKSPLSLSAQDIYHGMQIIEKNGYEEFQGQTKSKMASTMDYVRSIPKYFLSEPPPNKPNLPLVNQAPVENKDLTSSGASLNQ